MDHFCCLMFCVCYAFLSVHCNLVAICWERANLLALLLVLVMFLVFLSRSHVVSWIRCGALLYRFLIFAFLLTLQEEKTHCFTSLCSYSCVAVSVLCLFLVVPWVGK